MYPRAWAGVEHFRKLRGNELSEWPAWCFLPLAAWYAIVSADAGVEQLPPNLVGDVGRLAALGTWRYSQGIYRFDPEVYAALQSTDITGDMPAEVLYRLPEWCVYIETPGMSWGGQPLVGFWSHLEWDANTGRHELRLLLHQTGALTPLPLHIGKWPLGQAVARMAEEAELQATMADITFAAAKQEVHDIAANTAPLLSLLLYLCSDEPDIDDERQPGSSPERARPKRIKGGWRLFPARGPRTWRVGGGLGEELRQAQAEAEAGSGGRSVTPHLRRTHWHGFWSGPRGGDQKFRYRWLPPIFVKGGKA